MDFIVYKVDKEACEAFFSEYPKIRVLLSKKWNGRNMIGKYRHFIRFKDRIPVKDFVAQYGGSVKTVNSKTFGSKDFLQLNWGNVKGHWPELFQYINK